MKWLNQINLVVEVFDKYKKLYNKVSNIKKSIVTKENNFFS